MLEPLIWVGGVTNVPGADAPNFIRRPRLTLFHWTRDGSYVMPHQGVFTL